jgi:7-cyano-7-deazaguanine synthase
MKAVILLSGGLDSSVCLAEAAKESAAECCIFCDYGQAARKPEWEAAQYMGTFYGVRTERVELGWLKDLVPSGMREGAVRGAESAEDAWIPNRNGVFVNVAAAYAESLQCDTVIAGFNIEEAAEFPDNSLAFIDAVNTALSYSTKTSVRLESFTSNMSKGEILSRGIELGVPLSRIYSCYAGTTPMCGVCASCRLLKSAVVATECAALFADRFTDGSEIHR